MEAKRISRRAWMQGTAGAAAALSLPAGNSAQAPAPANTPSREEIGCARDGGNYLLNIGPRGDGSIPEESSRIFREAGQWLARNGEAIYAAERCPPMRSEFASFTRRGNTLYMHVYFWPGETVALSGLQAQVKSARLLATGKPVAFQQDRFRLRLNGLPDEPPDSPITTMAIECDAVPTQDQLRVRREIPRLGV
jgi:alpha-L-fucosidase